MKAIEARRRTYELAAYWIREGIKQTVDDDERAELERIATAFEKAVEAIKASTR